MLISKGYAAGDVICFKVVNGDEIIAKLVEEKTDGYVVSKPCTIIPSQQGLGLVQSLLSGDINSNITISKQHVIMHSPVINDIENHYIRTTSGIEVSKGIIK